MLKATLRSFLAHKARMVLSALAILLSVAFVAGTLMFTDTISKTFHDLSRTAAADVTVKPKKEFREDRLGKSGQQPTVPDSIVAAARSVPGVADAHPDITVTNVIVIDGKGKKVGLTSDPQVQAADWFPTKQSPVVLERGKAPQGPGEVILDSDSADHNKVRLGDKVHVVAAPGAFDATVVGLADFKTINPGTTMLFLDGAAARDRLLGKPGMVTSVSLTAEPGVDQKELKARVAAKLGGDVDVRTRAEEADASSADLGQALDVVKYALLGFAGVSLLVGTFLIFNTFSMLVAQRTRELGLMRAIGASRADVNRSVLVEATLLAVVGSTLGLLGGLGLAQGLLTLMKSLGVDLKGAPLVIKSATPIIAYTVGVVVTLVAAYLPARRAARVSPMAALREAGAPPAKSLRGRAVGGTAVTALGAIGLAVGASATKLDAAHGIALAGGLVATLVGFIVLGPVLARAVIPWLAGAFPRLFGTVGRLSRENALRNPRRTGATAAALMIGVALVASLSVVATSMKDSVGKQIDQRLGADYTLESDGGLNFTHDVAETVRKVSGVSNVVRQRETEAKVLFNGSSETITVTGADPGIDAMLKQKYTAGSAPDGLAPGRIALPKSYVKKHDLGVGGTVTLRTPNGRTAELRVGAVINDEGIGLANAGSGIVGLDTLAKLVPDLLDSVIMANVADGAKSSTVRAALETALKPYPQVKLRDQADYKQTVQDQTNIILRLVYGLLGLAIIIAILGVVNTLALSVIERTREIGLLRAIGMSRIQLRRMIRLESAVIAVFGAVLGLALGVGWGVAAQRMLASQGLDVLTIPWGTIAAVVVGAGVVGLLAALLPALRASRMNVLAAISTE
ncbi:ABC transporter permease [Embleya sp. NPDC020630]|uniref:ABC transporter permease n=1 Tax=Embleya sp. NPDC020630 TaxID=3363979 RepID=UPI003794C52B